MLCTVACASRSINTAQSHEWPSQEKKKMFADYFLQYKRSLMVVCSLLIASCGEHASTVVKPVDAVGAGQNWSHYLGDEASSQFSTLTQINKANVGQLRKVWQFELSEKGDPQTNPLVIDGTLYAYTPSLSVIALNAATGALRWRFDPGVRGADLGGGRLFTGPARGMSLWQSGNERRLLAGVMNYLYALDPETGKPISSFGENGAIDLRKNLGGDFTQHYVSLTAPGVVFEDVIIVGFRTSENPPAPAGDIRAYDVRSGQLRWRFKTIPDSGRAGAETWPAAAVEKNGGANSWAGFALDKERGIVYVPTGSAVPDFYGADRLGDNLYANSLVALDAKTGKHIWHFQTTHHDLWDRDLPSPPTLVSVRRDGKLIDAVAQTTKQGFVFVFDRVTGEPLFPIEERAVPASDVPGEKTSATQPFPLKPAPFARQLLTEDALTSRTPEAAAWAQQTFKTYRSAGQYVPFSLDKPTVVFPGFDGGAEWGGSAVDPGKGILYVNSNDVAWTGGLAENTAKDPGAALYETQCSVCHSGDRSGSPPAFPSLVNVAERLSAQDIRSVVSNGRGRMPAFSAISGTGLDQLVSYLLSNGEPTKPDVTERPGADAKQEMVSPFGRTHNAKYRFTGYNKFLDPDGYPAVQPPWGTLNAIDLNSGEYLWRIPLGEYPELTAQGVPVTGTENYGGPVLTASGLLFIGATVFDQKIRAFDSHSGELLWEAELPYAGTATPAVYMIDGQQYVVIATSNSRNPNAKQGNAYVAFSLGVDSGK